MQTARPDTQCAQPGGRRVRYFASQIRLTQPRVNMFECRPDHCDDSKSHELVPFNVFATYMFKVWCVYVAVLQGNHARGIAPSRLHLIRSAAMLKPSFSALPSYTSCSCHLDHNYISFNERFIVCVLVSVGLFYFLRYLLSPRFSSPCLCISPTSRTANGCHCHQWA